MKGKYQVYNEIISLFNCKLVNKHRVFYVSAGIANWKFMLQVIKLTYLFCLKQSDN